MEHCDFVPLRNMLIRTHLQDLKEVTNNVHYENYRCRKLAGVAGGTVEKIPNKVKYLTLGLLLAAWFLSGLESKNYYLCYCITESISTNRRRKKRASNENG